MRRTFLTVLALAAAAAATALAASGSSAAPATVALLSSQKSFVLQPGGAPAVGSRMIFTDALFNRGAQFAKPSGARVGSAEIVCTIVSRTKAQCSVTAHLPNGEVVAMGALTATKGLSHSTFAIVGGAGAYAHAGGVVQSRDLSQTRSLVTLRLS
jgi:hypothetical protein